MILEKQKESNVLESGEISDSIAMSLDLDSAQILMQMLSKNLYSDGIGSTVRECASNALDSHRRVGTKDPIIVSFGTNIQGNYEFAVEDFGIGLDADDVKNIISKYGKSTKRNSSTELGMMGLGFKAPLAYSSSFYFICRKDGMERKYMMYEGEDGNTIDLMYESETDQKNGVKVIVPVKYKDHSDFYHKIQEQLAYFENVYFDCGTIINNDFKITRTEHFQHSPLSKDPMLHLCLDNVYYPIDFVKLGISSIAAPIGLRFSLSDGIFPTPNREAIRYTKESIDKIKEKLEKTADFLVNKFNEGIEDSDDIIKIFAYFGSHQHYLNNYIPNVAINISSLKSHSKINFASPKMNNVELLDLKRIYHEKQYILWEYHKTYQYNGHRFYHLKKSWEYQFNNIEHITTERHYLHSEEITKLQKDYIRDIKTHGNMFFVKKYRQMPLGKLKGASTSAHDNYITILQLYNYPRKEWRARIKEFQYIISTFVSGFNDFDKFEVPEKWVQDRENAKKLAKASLTKNPRKKKLEGEVNGKVARRPEKYMSNGKTYVLENISIQMKDAHKDKKVTVICKTDDERLDQYFKTVRNNRVRFVVFSERELKRLKDIDLHNWITLDNFVEGKHRIFRRAVTAYLIDKLKDQHPKVFQQKMLLEGVSTSLYEQLVKLDDYLDKNYCEAEIKLFDDMVLLAEEKKLFDYKIYDVYQEVKFILEKLPFLQYFFSLITHYHDGEKVNQMMTHIKDLCKYHKCRLDWQNYKLTINEEPIKELKEEELEVII